MQKEEMVRTAKTLGTVFKILQRILILCAVVCVVLLGIFAVIHAIHPNAVTGTALNAVDLGPLTLELTEEVAPDSNAVLVYAWIMAAGVIAIIPIVCYALGIIRKILAPMAQGDPFHPTVGKEIRKLAFAGLAIGIIHNIMGAVGTFHVLHIVDLSALLQNSQIQSVTANYRYDLSFLVVFLVLLLMSHIFRYGEELQKLSDETL